MSILPIADDDIALATVIKTTLDVEGIEAVITHDGEEALVLARAHHPTLILVDVTMPGRSGIEVCATLKTDPGTASIPVIIITAKADDADRMAVMAEARGIDFSILIPPDIAKAFADPELLPLERG